MKRNGIGTASFVFAIFVLVMTCFGVLSMYQATLQYRMSVRCVEYGERYCSAQKAIHEKIARMQESDQEKTAQTLREPIDTKQDLIVCIEPEGELYRITAQYAENHDPWQEDDSIQLWSGKE